MDDGDFVERMYEGSVKGCGVMGETTYKLDQQDEYWNEVLDWEFKVLEESTWTGKTGDITTLATILGEVSMMGQVVRNVDR